MMNIKRRMGEWGTLSEQCLLPQCLERLFVAAINTRGGVSVFVFSTLLEIGLSPYIDLWPWLVCRIE